MSEEPEDDGGRESENDEEPEETKEGDGPESAGRETKWIPKVSKKSTVDQLREALEQLGLNTKGKKETLLRCVVSKQGNYPAPLGG